MTASVADQVWQALREQPSGLSLGDLAQLTGLPRKSVAQRVTHLRLVRLVTTTGRLPLRLHLTEEALALPTTPRVDRKKGIFRVPATTARQRLWTAMRVLKQFDLPQLLLVTNASRRATEDFVNALQRADIVKSVRGGRRESGWLMMRLVSDTGPKAPKVSRSPGRCILTDRNTGTQIDISPAATSLREKRQVNHV